MTSSREHSPAGSPRDESPADEPTVSELRYADLDTPLTGVLVGAQGTNSGVYAAERGQQREDAGPGGAQRPGLLLVHGGAGLDGHAREQAIRYARLGYVVLACDMFGQGVAASSRSPSPAPALTSPPP
jgi:alpha-beta hydrolase superfamily lysophospholipase